MKPSRHYNHLVLIVSLTTLVGCLQPAAPEEHSLRPLLSNTQVHPLSHFGVTGLANHTEGVYVVTNPFAGLCYCQNINDAYYASIRKFDMDGQLLWKRFINFGSGFPGFTHAEGVASDTYDNAYVLGNTAPDELSDVADPNNSVRDLYLRKYGTQVRPYFYEGAVLWTRHFGTVEKDEMAGDVAVYDNTVYVVGSSVGRLGTGGSTGGYDGFLRKYDSAGNLLWTTFITTSADDFANDVAVDDSGNIYVVGTTAGFLAKSNLSGTDMFLRKYAPNGAVLWTKQLDYGPKDYGQAVTVSGNTVYLGGGFLYGLNQPPNTARTPPEDMDVRVVQYGGDGTLMTDRSYGPTSADYLYDLSVADSGALYLVGATTGSFAETTSEQNIGYGYSYVMKLSDSGQKLWGKQQLDSLGTKAVLTKTHIAGGITGLERQVYVGDFSQSEVGNLRRLNPLTSATLWTR